VLQSYCFWRLKLKPVLLSQLVQQWLRPCLLTLKSQRRQLE
jgi:hypothetical protein